MSKMTSGVASAPLAQIDAPLLAVALAQGSVLPTSLADLDRAAGGVVARVITSGEGRGKHAPLPEGDGEERRIDLGKRRARDAAGHLRHARVCTRQKPRSRPRSHRASAARDRM